METGPSETLFGTAQNEDGCCLPQVLVIYKINTKKSSNDVEFSCKFIIKNRELYCPVCYVPSR